MNNLERYDWDNGAMLPNEDGEWVEYNVAKAEIERLRGFASWILEAYDNDEWPAQKDIVAGAREALGHD
jgi:hypothetical protein